MRPVRLSVRTPGFQPGKRGSTPLRAATCLIKALIFLRNLKPPSKRRVRLRIRERMRAKCEASTNQNSKNSLIQRSSRSKVTAQKRRTRQMSKFKRPIGMESRNDAEEQYRAGYQHGAQTVRRLIEEGSLDANRLVHWIEIDLQKWRYDETSMP